MTGLSSPRALRAAAILLGLGCFGLILGSPASHAQTETKTKANAKTAAGDSKAKAKAAEKASKSPAAPLDLNKATAEEMVEALPGVGEATAKKIVTGRPYASVDDLIKAGVPARTVEGIRSLVVVKPAAEEKAKPKEKAAAKEKGEAKGKMAKGAAAKAETPEPLSDKAKVNLNTGKVDELMTLPGIGEVTAKAIVAGRPYKSISDLDKVKGLGKTKIEALRPLVIVTGTAAAPSETPQPKTEATPKKEAATKKATAKAEEPAKKVMEKPAAEKTAAKPSAGGLKPGELVNINTASKEELDKLPGIGPVKAQAILDTRPFKTKEDIMKVKGIKEGEFGKIKDLITVD